MIALRCISPCCIKAIEQYGEQYHRVCKTLDPKLLHPYIKSNLTHVCEGCGGKFDGEKWYHICYLCGKEVKPGELTGLFVPTRCKECDEKIVAAETKARKVCRMCNQVYSRCCC